MIVKCKYNFRIYDTFLLLSIILNQISSLVFLKKSQMMRFRKALVLTLLLLFCFLSPINVYSEEYVKEWKKNSIKFDILHGFLKDLVVKIMYDENNPLPGGAFAISFSFDCIDFKGNRLGCGIYIDNQWGANKDEQYYFIPLEYSIICNDSFTLEKSGNNIITNKTAPSSWPAESESIRKLIDEMCSYSWSISYIPDSFQGTSQWILTRNDDPEKNKLYFNCVTKK